MVLIKLFLLLILADFLSGIGHWVEDAYGKPNDTWIGKNIIKANLEHHRTPRSFLARSYWSRNNYSIIFALSIALLAYFVGLFCWELAFVLFLLSQVNEIHAYAHTNKKDLPQWVQFLQKYKILQDQLHHGWHHKAPYEVNYCIITPFLNPIFEVFGFWNRLEKLLLKHFKINIARGSECREGY